MKKLLFLLLIVFLFSCEKGTESCKICVTVTTITPISRYSAYNPIVEETIFEACGEELKKVDGENITAPTSIFGSPAIMKRTTKCN